MPRADILRVAQITTDHLSFPRLSGHRARAAASKSPRGPVSRLQAPRPWRAGLRVEDHEFTRQAISPIRITVLTSMMLSRRKATLTMECLNSMAMSSVMIMPNTVWKTL